MGTTTPKVYLELGNTTVLGRCLRRLKMLADDAQIVLAVHPEDRATHLQPLLPEFERLGLTDVVDGGATRQESMQIALAVCEPERDLIVIHDAARPFFPIAAAKQAMHRAADVGAALLAAPVPDTLKRVDAEFRVEETVDRSGLWQAQTPQVVQRSLLERAIARANADGFVATDDAALLEYIDVPVEIVPSTPKNLKLTIAADLELAAVLADLEDQR
jgi:2-C-methyl-D-erythritol 4-phosphate cytidylyltransferase